MPNFSKQPQEQNLPLTLKFIWIFLLADIIFISLPTLFHYLYVNDYQKISSLWFFTFSGAIIGILLGEQMNFIMLMPYLILMFIYALFYKYFIIKLISKPVKVQPSVKIICKDLQNHLYYRHKTNKKVANVSHFFVSQFYASFSATSFKRFAIIPTTFSTSTISCAPDSMSRMINQAKAMRMTGVV